MNSLIERLGLKPKSKTVEQPVRQPTEEQIIEPATATEKERLESQCQKYLNNPKTDTSDFSNFVSNMVALIGGRSKEDEIGNRYNYSKWLTDDQGEASISFRFSEGGIRASYLAIESKEKSEDLSVTITVPSANRIPDYDWRVKFHSPSPKFESYITGKDEPTQLTASRETLKEREVKDLARRVFGVYRQGQPTQSPTPQS